MQTEGEQRAPVDEIDLQLLLPQVLEERGTALRRLYLSRLCQIEMVQTTKHGDSIVISPHKIRCPSSLAHIQTADGWS